MNIRTLELPGGPALPYVEQGDPAGMPVVLLLGTVVACHDDFPPLRRSNSPGRLTVVHMHGARDLADYERRARGWAEAVWRSWADQHDLIRAELAAAES